MADPRYDALIAAWNNPTQPPPGVTGAGLAGTDTTDQKIVKVNAWAVSGAIPTSFYTTGDQILNCINYAEFKALTAAQQSNLLLMLSCPGQLLGGSANTAFIVDGMMLDYFTAQSVTISNLTKLAKAVIQLWWQAPVNQGGGGLTGPVSHNDCTIAGLS